MEAASWSDPEHGTGRQPPALALDRQAAGSCHHQVAHVLVETSRRHGSLGTGAQPEHAQMHPAASRIAEGGGPGGIIHVHISPSHSGMVTMTMPGEG